jgi:hypothetical protein
MPEIEITKDSFTSFYPDSVSVTFDDTKFTVDDMEKHLLQNQIVVNRIKMIIKDKENELEIMEQNYPNIDSESHKLHHSWVAKLDNIDMFKALIKF